MFQRLLVLRCLRPEKIMAAVSRLVEHTLGADFIAPPPFDLGSAFLDSSATSPLIFILSPGVDPSKRMREFAEESNMADSLVSISLGQGQGPHAENCIREVVVLLSMEGRDASIVRQTTCCALSHVEQHA